MWIQICWAFKLSLASYGAALATGVVLWSLTSWLSRHSLSAAGQRTRTQLFAFRKFLSRAERERVDRMPPDTLHKLLPWAIALRVTDAWFGHFKERPVAPPAWYQASKPVGVAELRDEIKHLYTLVRPRGR